MASKPRQFKILQVMAGARFGGAETAFADTCIALHEAGHDQLIVTRNYPERLARFKEAGLPVITLPFGGKIDFFTTFALDRIINKFQPDIVQTWMARAASKVPAKKGRDYKVLSRLGNYYNLKYFKQTDHFLCIAPYVGDYLRKEGIATEQITFFPNFADTLDKSMRAVLRSDLDTPENATVLLTLARYHKAKALDVAIRALKDLPDAYLWCAGQGPEESNLKLLAQEEGVYDRIRFLGWRNDRGPLLEAADICLFISRYEPFGTVFVQAWAHKTPVIVSDADGPKQFVKNNEDALIVPKDDIEALVGAVKKMQKSNMLKKELVENGWKRYQSEFNKKTAMENYQNLFEKMTIS